MMSPPKRICLICVEIFAYGKYGGFGKATRTIGRELAKRGYEVFAVVPRRLDQPPEVEIDGITVLSYLPGDVLSSGELYRRINADIYHSCEPSFGSYLAKKYVPSAKHVFTIRYPRNAYDWYLELKYPSKSKWQVIKNYLYEANFMVCTAVRNGDGVFSPAHFMLPKIRSIYGLNHDPIFLPTPVIVPENIQKSPNPKVMMMSRLDPRKRPELFLSMAEKFPEVEFHVAGKSRIPQYEMDLKEKYNRENITFHGFVDQFKGTLHHELMEQSWILANTAILEGLPNAFLEASAHQAAILSFVNPDNFASDYGFHAAKDNFEEGLTELLTGNQWKSKAMNGYNYVKETFALDKAINLHEDVYHKLFLNHH